MLGYQTTTIDLLRHGECEGGRIFRGSTDVKLSEEGWQSMQAKMDWCARTQSYPFTWQSVLSSPMLRCRQFADQLAQSRGVPCTIEDDLRETFFGKWEGRLVEEIMETEREHMDNWFRDPAQYYPPGGEPTAEFMSRVHSVLDKAIDRYRGQKILMVSHGGVMRALLSAVLDLPLSAMNRFEIPYACLSRIEIFHSDEGDYRRLSFHNVLLN